MKIINVITKEVVAGEVMNLPLCKNQSGDTVVGEIYIDIPENLAITVDGSVDGDNWHSLKVVNMGTFEKKSSISTAGYYMLPAAGLAKAKLTFGSAGTVTVKTTF